MLIITFFAFIAGIVTILSPCILPILPIVLSGSVQKGKRRPLGIVTGFVISFSFFTLFLSAIIRATGISSDFLRLISVFVIFIFGISFLVPKFQLWFGKLFSKISFGMTQQKSDGFFGGVSLGFSLGLIWTPCVGPILASVITLAISGEVSLAAVVVMLSYAVGTALPMLGITYGGKALLDRVPWLLKNTTRIQKWFGVVMILMALLILFDIDKSIQSYILRTFPGYGDVLTRFEDSGVVQNNLDNLK